MDIPFEIRNYRPGDFNGLVELWELTGMGGKERGDDMEVIRKTIDNGGCLLVMTIEGRLIGSSWMSHDSRRMFIHHFAIHPDFQGRGLSKPLMEDSMAFCRSRGLQVKLEVHRDNARAVHLYKSFGFRELEGYDVYIARELQNKKP